MNKTYELVHALKEHPDRELVFMYPEEGSDHYYTFGQPSKVLVDEYATIDDRVWVKSDEDLLDSMADEIADEMFSYQHFPLTEEQHSQVDKELNERVNNLNWKKAIIVYIQPK